MTLVSKLLVPAIVAGLMAIPATAYDITLNTGVGAMTADRDAVCKNRLTPHRVRGTIGGQQVQPMVRAYYEPGRNGDVQVTYPAGVHTTTRGICGPATVRVIGGHGGGGGNPGFKPDTTPTVDKSPKAH